MYSKSLIAGNIHDLQNISAPEARLWCEVGKLVGNAGLPIDRLGITPSPFRVHVAENCKLPNVPTDFKKTYREICLERAKSLLELQDTLGKPIYVLYSGGIDSTAVLTSFFVTCGNQSELKDRLIVCMNQSSINENTRFYKNHILGKLRLISSERALHHFDGRGIVIGGEHNDQVFGNFLTHLFDSLLGNDFLDQKFDTESCKVLLQTLGFSEKGLEYWTERFSTSIRIQNLAPIKSMRDFLWWVNFNYKWQATYFSLVLRVPCHIRPNVNQRYLAEHFDHFFNHPDFQLWSIFNGDKKIRDSWKTYKWPAKDLILDFTGDQQYHEFKIKAPSLNYVLTHTKPAAGMTSDYEYLQVLDPDRYLETLGR